MPVSRRTRAEHDKPISKVQKFIDGVGFWTKGGFVVANLAPSTVTIQTDQTGDFSNVHNFVKNFVWDPTLQFKAHIVANRAARHLRLKTLEKEQNKTKKSQGVLPGTVCIVLYIDILNLVLLSSWPERNWRIRPARRFRAGFRKFSKKNSCIARARRGHAGLTVYPPMIQIADVVIDSSQSCDRKSKFGLRHGIKLTELYAMTKSEFWFSMIPPRTSDHNVRSFVPVNSTVKIF